MIDSFVIVTSSTIFLSQFLGLCKVSISAVSFPIQLDSGIFVCGIAFIELGSKELYIER